MADFREILLNVDLLKEEFSKFNFKEADKVRENLAKADDSLKKIPQEVLDAIDKTGFSLADFEIKVEVPVEREVVVKKRKNAKKALILEEQKFYIEEYGLRLRKQGPVKKGSTVKAYNELSTEQKEQAKALIDAENLERSNG